MRNFYACIYKLLFVLVILYIITVGKVSAQVPTVQDCLGAIPVCQDIYEQPIVYGGQGNYPNEINSGQNCPNSCMDGETNSIWYVISVKTGGMLRFVISPVMPDDDYDWAVYNLNDYECEDIFDNAQAMQKSCNAAGGPGFHGPTGISTLNGGDKHCNGGGNTDKWNADLPVQAGDTYVLCVSNWTATSSAGYTLDFSASTADIFDDVPAYVTLIDTVRGCSGSATVDFDFNENILCSSVQPEDFLVIAPDGTEHFPNSVSGAGCELNGNQEKFFTLSSFYPPITQTGLYTLRMVGEVEDLCLNMSIAPDVQFYAEMDPLPDFNLQPEDAMVPVGGTATFSIESVGATTFKWQKKVPGDVWWINLTEEAPYSGVNTNTLSIGPATFPLGGYQFRCNISGECDPAKNSDAATLFVGDQLSAAATASPEAICFGETSALDVNAFGGNIQNPYAYAWSTPDGNVFSTSENPVVAPTETTTYTVEVSDGFNPVSIQVTVTVYPLPLPDAGADTNIYHGSNTILLGSVPGGVTPITWNWQPSNILWDNAVQNPSTKKLFEPVTFTLTVTDGHGCTSDPANQVTVGILGGPLQVSASALPDSICFGDSTTLIAAAGGGNPQYSFTWKVNGVEVSDAAELRVSPSATTTYSVTLFDEFNEITDNITVKVNPLPVLKLLKDNYTVQNGAVQVCVFDSLVIDPGYSNGEYLWSNGNTTFTNTLSTSGIIFDTQIHSVKVTDMVTRCVEYDTLQVDFTFIACSYGVEEMEFDNLVRVYPNPANQTAVVSIDGHQDKFLIEMLDLRGQLLYRESLSKQYNGIINHELDLDAYATGTYFIRVVSQSGCVVRKLIISK